MNTSPNMFLVAPPLVVEKARLISSNLNTIKCLNDPTFYHIKYKKVFVTHLSLNTAFYVNKEGILQF